MAMNKKEKTLVVILGVLVYLFLFVKVVLVDSMNKIKEKQQALDEVQSRKEVLEMEYQNINYYTEEMKVKSISDERLGAYLMNGAGLSDSIVFIENLAIMLNTELKNISLGIPQKLTTNDGVDYYGFPVKFRAAFPYHVFQDIIQYCEGGSRKVRISSFSMSPSTERPGKAGTLNDKFFDVSLDLVFYSIDEKAADELYKFSHSRFQEFRDKDGEPIFIKTNEELPEIEKPKQAKTDKANNADTTDNVDKADDDVAISRETADFIIYHTGSLTGSYNFETFSNANSDERIRRFIEGEMNVLLTLKNNTYTIEAEDPDKTDRITGTLNKNEFTFFIDSNVKDIKENERIQLNIKIKNDSGKDIRVKVNQTGDRVKLMDRDGNIINIKDDEEKVYL